jgi:DNA-binding response OmpR family regulator
VLLAEDDVLLRNLVRHTLERAGFLVFAAANGFEALALSQAYPGRIDVLITDMDMADMSGITIAWHVRGERPETLIIVLSRKVANPVEGPETVFLPRRAAPATIVRKLKDMLGGADCSRSREN